MFGYIKVVEDELKVKELRRYRNYYCGLCRQMGYYSQFSRLMLSYDMTFFAMLMEANMSNERQMCRHKLLKHCKKACGDERMKYIAAVSEIFLYYNFQNDYRDGNRKSLRRMKRLRKAHDKAAGDYPDIENSVRNTMERLYQLEDSQCNDFQKLEKCCCEMFRDIYTLAPFSDSDKGIRGEIAYHVGSWIYWFDMLKDMEKDRKNGEFNAILLQDSESAAIDKVRSLLIRHAEESLRFLELLPNSENIPIIRNIIEVGLAVQMEKESILSQDMQIFN